MKERIGLYRFSKLLENIRSFSDDDIETTNGITYTGSFNSESTVILNELKNFILEVQIEDILYLKIDTVKESWKDVNFVNCNKWSISISDKQSLLNKFMSPTDDIKRLLFFDKEYFENNWLDNASGLNNPIEEGELQSDLPYKIYVHGLDNTLGGPRVAILPINNEEEQIEHSQWLTSLTLPDIERIKKNVHIISSKVEKFHPANFLITWGDVNCDIANKFHIGSAKALLYTLVQEYYNYDKISLNGKKRLEVSMTKQHENNFSFINKAKIDSLLKVVTWCYAEDDESTRILLIIDRLSLDIDLDKGFLNVLTESMDKAYDEAKSRYKYVVLDRKTEYTKELSELQKDLGGVVDKYVSSTNDFILSFLKDLLTFAFILTVGVVAKKVVDEKILFTQEATILFKALSLYLIFSLLLRLWHYKVVVEESERVISIWKDIVRNHMSKDELNGHIKSTLIGVKKRFRKIVCVVSILYICSILISWYNQKVLGVIFSTSYKEKEEVVNSVKYLKNLNVYYEKSAHSLENKYLQLLVNEIKKLDKSSQYVVFLTGHSSLERLISNKRYSDNFQLSRARVENLKAVISKIIIEEQFLIHNFDFIVKSNGNSKFSEENVDFENQRFCEVQFLRKTIK